MPPTSAAAAGQAGAGSAEPAASDAAAREPIAPELASDEISPIGHPVLAERGRVVIATTVSALALVGVLVLAAGLYWVWRHPRPDPAAAATLERVNALQTELAGLAQRQDTATTDIANTGARLDRVEAEIGQLAGQMRTLAAARAAAPAPATPPAAAAASSASHTDVAALSARVDTLAARQDTVAARQQAALTAVTTHVDVLTQQAEAALGRLEARVGKAERSAGAVSGLAERAARLAQLQAAEVALADGEPLGDLPGAPPALARFAHQPPPTEAQLRLAFPALAAAAERAAAPATGDQPLLARMWARVKQSVTVRRDDEVIVGNPIAGVLAQAQRLLDAGDLAAAVRELGALQGPPAVVLRPWLAEANALLAARAALATMGMHAALATTGTQAALATMGVHAALATMGTHAALATTGVNAALATIGTPAALATIGTRAALATMGTPAALATTGMHAALPCRYSDGCVPLADRLRAEAASRGTPVSPVAENQVVAAQSGMIRG